MRSLGQVAYPSCISSRYNSNSSTSIISTPVAVQAAKSPEAVPVSGFYSISLDPAFAEPFFDPVDEAKARAQPGSEAKIPLS